MESEERIIEADRKLHPNCHYSMSNRSSCSNNEEGKFVCDSIKQIFRHCSGQRPVSIYTNKVQQDPSEMNPFSPKGGLFGGGGGGNGPPSINDLFGGFFGGPSTEHGGIDPELDSIFDQLQKEMERQLGSQQKQSPSFPFAPGNRLHPPSTHRGVDPHGEDSDIDWNINPKKIPKGYLEGPAEDI